MLENEEVIMRMNEGNYGQSASGDLTSDNDLTPHELAFLIDKFDFYKNLSEIMLKKKSVQLAKKEELNEI